MERGRGARGHPAQAHVLRRDTLRRILRVRPRGSDRQGARRAARARSDSVARRRVAEIVFALGVHAGRRGGQLVDTWGEDRVDLRFRSVSKIAQMAFTRVAPNAPLPKPFEWPNDSERLESRKVSAARRRVYPDRPGRHDADSAEDAVVGRFVQGTLHREVLGESRQEREQREGHSSRCQRPGAAALLPALDERVGDQARRSPAACPRTPGTAYARRPGLLLRRHQADRRAQEDDRTTARRLPGGRRRAASPSPVQIFEQRDRETPGQAEHLLEPADLERTSCPRRAAESTTRVDPPLRDDPTRRARGKSSPLLHEMGRSQGLDHLGVAADRLRDLQGDGGFRPPCRNSATILSESSRSGPANCRSCRKQRLLTSDGHDAPRDERRSTPRPYRESARQAARCRKVPRETPTPAPHAEISPGRRKSPPASLAASAASPR